MGLPKLWLAVTTLLTQHTYSQFEARTSIFVDDTEVEIVANADRDDFAAVGRDVCAKMGVDLGATLRDGRMRCGALIADELADSLYCNATARGALDAALADSGRAPRAFRFYHGEFYFDSEEYELLRELLLRQRYVECLSGERLRGGEDVIWLLGHFDGDAWFYKALDDSRADAAQRIFTAPLAFGDFLAVSRDKRDVAASLPYGLDTSLYLLLTDRRRVDGAAAGTLADPNVLDDASPLQGLLDKAVAATAPLVDAAPLPRAWTSLRYGAGYAYPTHVDC